MDELDGNEVYDRAKDMAILLSDYFIYLNHLIEKASNVSKENFHYIAAVEALWLPYKHSIYAEKILNEEARKKSNNAIESLILSYEKIGYKRLGLDMISENDKERIKSDVERYR